MVKSQKNSPPLEERIATDFAVSYNLSTLVEIWK